MLIEKYFSKIKGINMQLNIFKTAAWQLILQSDWVCRLILLGLFAASVFCIAIIIYKVIMFNRHTKQLKILLERINKICKFQDIVTLNKDLPSGVGGKLLHSALAELKLILEKHAKNNPGGIARTISIEEFELLEQAIQQEIANIIEEEESYLSVLASFAAVAPLIGLFGTIWGLIHSFIDIAQEKSADIATVAPGLAEALTTTLAGLIVAIPALFAYHYLTRKLYKVESSLLTIGDKFIRILRQTFNNQDMQ
jgi:biopolymer transport protein TolQ